MNKESDWGIYRPFKYTWKLKIGNEFNMLFWEGGQPNRFHRWMQEVFLGFKWERINE